MFCRQPAPESGETVPSTLRRPCRFAAPDSDAGPGTDRAQRSNRSRPEVTYGPWHRHHEGSERSQRRTGGTRNRPPARTSSAPRYGPSVVQTRSARQIRIDRALRPARARYRRLYARRRCGAGTALPGPRPDTKPLIRLGVTVYWCNHRRAVDGTDSHQSVRDPAGHAQSDSREGPVLSSAGALSVFSTGVCPRVVAAPEL